MGIRGLLKRHRQAVVGAVLVFVVALIPRLYGVGLFLTADEKNWVGRSYEFLKAFSEFRINDTLQTTHPGITTLWLSGIATFVATRVFHTPFNFDDLHRFVTFAQVPMAIGNALLVAGIFLALRLLVSRHLALLGALAVALDPFLIGYSKVVHVDAFLAGFLTIAALLFVYAEEKNSEWVLIASAVTGALAILSKMPGVFILPFALLVLFSRPSSWRKDEVVDRLRFFGQWLFLLVMVILLLWPALLWVPNPLGNANQVRRDMTTAFLTPHHMEESYTINPWHYPATLAVRSTIPVMIGVLALAALWAFPRTRTMVRRHISARALALFCACIGFFLVMMLIGAKKGDRYILPVFPLLDVLGAAGILLAVEFVGRARGFSVTMATRVAAAILLLPLLAHLVRLGPYALAYYNPLFRPDLSQELGWGEGLDQVARFLDAQPDDALVASWYPEELRALTKRPVLHINAHEQERIGYVVLYRNMFGRAPDHWANDFIDEYYRKREPVFVAHVNGLEYAWVYKKPVFTGVVGRVTPGKTLVTTVGTVTDNLSRIDVATATYSGTARRGTFILRVRETIDGRDLRRVSRPVADLPDSGYAEFSVEPIPGTAGKTLFLLLSTEGTDDTSAPTVRFAAKEAEASYALIRGPLSAAAYEKEKKRGLLGVRWHFRVDGRDISQEEAARRTHP